MSRNKIAIIGAGASGMMAAITAASKGGQVTLYEKKARVGQKILVTGNGKCNLSNVQMGVDGFYSTNKERMKSILHKFSVNDTITFFQGLGVMIRDKGGYLYPYSEQAQVILDVLRLKIYELGIEVVYENEITEVIYSGHECKDEKFSVGGRIFDNVIVACGSKAAQKKGDGKSGYQIAEALGQQMIKVVPGLCKLICQEKFLKALAGVRCQAKLTMMVNGVECQIETGELQFTAEAISGIPVFQLSRTVAYALAEGNDVVVMVDFFPELSDDEYAAFCYQRIKLFPHKTLEDFLMGMTNKKINQVMINLYGLKYNNQVSDIEDKKMLVLLKGYRNLKFIVKRTDSFENAQVCAGGVSLDCLNDELESLIMPGLYFAGEIIDVDGRCGGYNLQWAWSSGYVTGMSAAQE